MEEEIIKADPSYRRKLFSVYVIVIIVGVLFIWLAIPRLISFLRQSDLQTTLILIETIFLLFLLSFIFPSIYLFRFGRRIIRDEQMPYQGMKVIRNTKVIKGRKAVFLGKVLMYLGIFCIFFVLLSSGITHYLFVRFKNDPFLYINK